MKPQAASPTAVIDAESLAKIRTLLATGTSEGVSLGCALLESLGATAADFDAALAPPVGQTVADVANRWLQGDEQARGEYDQYHRLVVAPRFVAQRTADRAAGRSFLELVEIAAGEFEMGSDEFEMGSDEFEMGSDEFEMGSDEFEMGSDEFDGEKPVHRVQITRAFLLGKTTVTQGQWWSVMGTLPWQGQEYVKEGPDVAATYVSWADAVEFCARLTKLEQSSGTLCGNRRYRLPTEAEWEYACRAGTKTKVSFGDDEARLGEFAWFDRNADSAGESYAHEVGQKKPNPWGLHDMHGNVWEWCSDWYDEDYYAKSPAADPEGPVAGSFRVSRGGGWNFRPVYCRSANRISDPPTIRSRGIGFRVACELE